MNNDLFHAENAARHAWYNENGSLREERIKNLELAGVKTPEDAKNFAHEVRTADDTRCFLGANGREVYANDRLNAIHISNESKPEKNTVFVNDKDKDVMATQRLAGLAKAERDQFKIPCVERDGGSKALEADREAERAKAQEKELASVKEVKSNEIESVQVQNEQRIQAQQKAEETRSVSEQNKQQQKPPDQGQEAQQSQKQVAGQQEGFKERLAQQQAEREAEAARRAQEAEKEKEKSGGRGR